LPITKKAQGEESVIFTSYKHISKQGSKANEDYAFSCEHFIFVIDGASGLAGKNYSNYGSDAQWLAHRLGELLKERLGNTTKTIAVIVSEAIRELRTEYENFLSETECDTLAMPSAGMAAIRVNGDNIEVFHIGDCSAILLTNDGKPIHLQAEALVKLDDGVISNVVEVSKKKNISFSEALVYGKEQLIINRKKLNKPDGYWILDLTGVGVEHACIHSFSVCDVQVAAVMTDGFSELVDLVGFYDYKGLLEHMETRDLALMCDELFKAHDEDPTFDKYPRFKLHDDSSAAWCRIQNIG
jgi:hypothetical protein